jgi:WD40 repeat protein
VTTQSGRKTGQDGVTSTGRHLDSLTQAPEAQPGSATSDGGAPRSVSPDMTPTHRLSRRSIAAVALSLGVAACGESTTAPGVRAATRVAVTTYHGDATLFVQDSDGTNRTRIRFTNVTNAVQGNSTSVVVSDTAIHTLGTPAWDPAGREIAVAAEVSSHALILVMRADGTGGEVASSDAMLIGSDPQWSPDGRKIAYIASTLADLDVHDIYVTDLSTHTVTRVTNGAHAVGAALGWSPDGASIIYSRLTGSTRDDPDNFTSELEQADVSSGTSRILMSDVLGQITGIARSGDRVLLSRAVPTPGGAARQLIELTVAGSERVLVDSTVWSGHYAAGNDAVLTTAAGSGISVNFGYEILDVQTGRRTPLIGVTGQAGVDLSTPRS